MQTQPASKEFDLFPALKVDQAERYYCMPDLSSSEGHQFLACRALLLMQNERFLKNSMSATSPIRNLRFGYSSVIEFMHSHMHGKLSRHAKDGLVLSSSPWMHGRLLWHDFKTLRFVTPRWLPLQAGYDRVLNVGFARCAYTSAPAFTAMKGSSLKLTYAPCNVDI